MIRKQARQRRDYLHRRAITLRDAEISEKRAKLRASLASGKPLDPSIAKDTGLRKDLPYDESQPDLTTHERLDMDDEYAELSGIVEPRVMVTTSRDPSTRLAAFSKEIRLLFPTAIRLNRGNLILPELVHSCKSNGLSDVVLLHEHRGHDSVELAEVGPRMTMRAFEIRNSTLENKDGDVEWHLSQYTRTGRKKNYL
ncbi:U3 small nucleolar ribonucleoprotein IMP4 [Ceratocystis platani]|uniref:U3 small nucleolar ribonucleoprotein protein IMP4 n=1 Tax=Ceratocystis fimbriata f. sp. platani TaxID=88771 RepID=A0A0F8BYA1_CERFI|nr:U3 small nucleolar ribonucleoprotein IMP4 [Ceratocystis platani]